MGNTVWNPRYLEYCRVQSVDSPEDMLKIDDERWPGGVMCGYTLWIQEKWRLWRKDNGIGANDILGKEAHSLFDRWLALEER